MEVPLRNGKRVGLIHGEVKVGMTWKEIRGVVPAGFDSINHVGTTDGAAALWGRRRVTADAHMRFNRSARKVDADHMKRAVEALRPVFGVDLIISGHTVLDPPVPRAVANLLFIDTGAYNDNGRLTFADPLSGVYWQVGRQRGRPRAMRREAAPFPEPLEIPSTWLALK